MRLVSTEHNTVFLTGATGFVGKVVLHELVRRRAELAIGTIYVLIRDKKGKAPQQRFEDEIAASRAFELLPKGWARNVRALGGELTQRDCGLSPHDVELVQRSVTRIVHCAASVEFDLPIADAAAANITSALNVLEMARGCRMLQRMVSVSTAYVTPWRKEAIHETLVPLPRSAASIYQSILAGKADEKALLAETGHPNTYTFTKCVVEHLLMERRGEVPLAIVRPSIVAASWRQPFPGWIDSAAAFAGFALMIGMGHMKALIGDRASRLDIVPVDVVSDRIIEAAFAGERESLPKIRFAVAGLQHSCRIDTCAEIIARFYRSHPIDKTPGLHYIGPNSNTFKVLDARHHQVPTKLAATVGALVGNKKLQKNAKRLADKIAYLNHQFPYFTTKTFDFRATEALDDALFRREEYLEVVCRGVYRYLLKRDDSEMLLAGRQHKDNVLSDLQWAAKQPSGNWAIRTFAVAVRKALRQSTTAVTFDRESFSRAVDAAAPGSVLVLIPSHRSYMDFLLCSYLFFARPDLGIAIPHIAAADEFSKIPLLGRLFVKTQAFYLRRGGGRDPELVQHVHELVDKRETIQFFIEGARSRSRQFLPPKHGLLRCLQETGETFTLLPIALTYDRVPEEDSLVQELSGAAKPEMRLEALAQWVVKLAKGGVDLGRVHIACGDPVVMAPGADLREISRHVVAELQAHTATTSFHLRAFLHHADVQGIDYAWLRDTIERRGGTVIESPLSGEEYLDRIAEMSLRYQWQHLFYREVEQLWPNHPALHHHVALNGYHQQQFCAEGAELSDPRLQRLLKALFEPIARDYAATAQALGAPQWPPRHATPRGVGHELSDAYLPNIQACFDDLKVRGILATGEDGRSVWGPHAHAIEAYRTDCAWYAAELQTEALRAAS